MYCQKSALDSTGHGVCVQCVSGKCLYSFHVTCSFHNGVPLYTGDWPLVVETVCHKHSRTKSRVSVFVSTNSLAISMIKLKLEPESCPYKDGAM